MQRCSSARQSKLVSHIKDKHPECIPAEGRSLLDMGFTTTRADVGPNGPESPPVDDDPIGPPDLSAAALVVDNPNLLLGVVSRDTSATLQVPVATAERGVGMGQEFWRFLTRSLDGVIKSNSTAQVIPSAEAIAAEVLRQQQQHRTEQQGTGVSRENWLLHTVEADIVRDAGLAYREIDGGPDRDIICPVCRDHGRGNGVETFFYFIQRLKNLRKGIQRHLAADAHKNALTE